MAMRTTEDSMRRIYLVTPDLEIIEAGGECTISARYEPADLYTNQWGGPQYRTTAPSIHTQVEHLGGFVDIIAYCNTEEEAQNIVLQETERRAREIEERKRAEEARKHAETIHNLKRLSNLYALSVPLHDAHTPSDPMFVIIDDHAPNGKGECLGCRKLFGETHNTMEQEVMWPCPVVELELTRLKHNGDLSKRQLDAWNELTLHRRD